MIIQAARTNSLLVSLSGCLLAFILLTSGLMVAPHIRKLVSPQSDSKADPFDQVILRLENIPNDITLKKNPQFIPAAKADEPFDEASSYMVVDADTGEILADKSPENAFYIASLTKMMTAIVATDLASQNEVFTITTDATEVSPTKMGLVPGQKWTLNELLHGLLLTSANDAAQEIKDGINQKYGQGTFIRAMNAKAKFLGLKTTSYANPQGFDDVHNFSTSHDLAVLALYIYKNYPNLSEIVKKRLSILPRN